MLFGFEDPPEAEASRAIDDEQDAVAEPPPTTRRLPLLALGLLVGLMLGLGTWALWPDSDQLTQADVDDAVATALDAQADGTPAAADVYEQIALSVVVVNAARAGNGTTIGSGVVINDQGHILTANHVIDGASAIDLRYVDGATSTAEVLTTDEDLDIAVLVAQNSTGAVVPAVIGNSRTLKIGDPIYAVGNPLGLTASLTAGVISGLSRSIALATDDAGELANLIQFDAAVNRGSSGGPLVNADGQVIGIVTARAEPAGEGIFTGIGFAVPIDIAAGQAADGPSQ